MLVIKDLVKTYASGVRALSGVSLELSPGVFGLLGPNGSGKTTLMKIVATLLEPDSGTIQMNGVDLMIRKDHTHRMLGYLPQDFGLYPTLTAWQMLDYLARLKGVTNRKERHTLIDALLERVNLWSARTQRLRGFSGGMRQRLGIAQALIGQPELIIFTALIMGDIVVRDLRLGVQPLIFSIPNSPIRRPMQAARRTRCYCSWWA